MKTVFLKFLACGAVFTACNVSASADVVYLADSLSVNATENQPWAPTILGTGFDSGDSITSGTTTIGSASTYTLSNDVADGRFWSGNSDFNNTTNTTTPAVAYDFSTPRDLSGLLFWNYSEVWNGGNYSARGLGRADITIVHSGGTTKLEDIAFALSPTTGTTPTTSAQTVNFGATYTGVTSITFDELRSTQVQLVGWTRVAFTYSASAPVVDPSVVHLADSLSVFGRPDIFTSNQSFDGTILGTGFDSGNSIISGTTTVGSASIYTLSNGVADGRFTSDSSDYNNTSNTTTPAVVYNFSTARDLSGLLFWNYSEIWNGGNYSARGLGRADITIVHSGGTTILEDIAFALSPTTGTTPTTSAQTVNFGATYTGVTSIRFDELRSTIGASVGWTRVAFTYSASAPVVHPPVVHLADSLSVDTTQNQPFADTMLGTGFDSSNSIISGTTTVGSASVYTLSNGVPDGRFLNTDGFNNTTNTTTPSVVYNFSTARNLDGLLFWNYSEIYAGVSYSARGLTRADITIAHSGGTTKLENVVFTLSDTSLTPTTSAQTVNFGATYTGVTSIRFDELRSSQNAAVGWTRAAFTGSQPSGAYDTWANGTFANDFTDRLPTDDPDGDGQTNQAEFAFGLDPTTGSSVNPITRQLTDGVFKYTRTKDSGLTYKVYYSTTLTGWTWDEFATQSPAAAVAGVETVTVTLAAAAPLDGKLFVRVEATPVP